jgi:hypothetical protein
MKSFGGSFAIALCVLMLAIAARADSDAGYVLVTPAAMAQPGAAAPPSGTPSASAAMVKLNWFATLSECQAAASTAKIRAADENGNVTVNDVSSVAQCLPAAPQ